MSKLSPATVEFNNDILQSAGIWLGWPRPTVTKTETIDNQIFSGVLKIHSFNGDWHTYATIIQGPIELVGKYVVINSSILNEALKDITLLSDSKGYYLENTWVFIKRGARVRLDIYKA